MRPDNANKEIAVSLSITDSTVKTHVANIFQKLDVSGRTEAVTQALQIGIISLKSGRAGGAPFLQRADPPVPLLSRVDRLQCRFALFGFARLLPWP